jgi:hypothetical protein
MTLPYEEVYALNNTRQFLRDLLDPQKTPKVPLKYRIGARACLKHFPMEYRVDKVYRDEIE